MKNNLRLKGEKIHFNIAIYILLILLFITCVSYGSNSFLKMYPQLKPEQVEINELYDFITNVSTITDSLERYQLANAIYIYGEQYNIEPQLLLAIITVESNFKKEVISYTNCAGYYQVNLNIHKVSKNFLNDTYEQTSKACEVYNYFRRVNQGVIYNALNDYNGNDSLKNYYAKNVLINYNYYKTLMNQNNGDKIKWGG